MPKVVIDKDIFNDIYYPHLNNHVRTQIFYGGSSSGKSVFLAQRCVFDILQGKRNYLVCRAVARTIRRSVFNEIHKVIKDWNLSSKFAINRSDGIITCTNGKQILFAGLDDTEKVKSITPENGVITISTSNQYIEQPSSGDDVQEGDYVVLEVSDTGTGIAKEDLSRIFEPFYTKKVMGRSGTGLGMAVVWGTVRDHKGYIEIDSAEGKGTTFTLYFPVTRKKPGGGKRDFSMADYKGKGESILIIDDVKEQREIASSILTQLGYSVSTVACGEAAVEFMKNNAADMLVLDMIMDPGIDGFETYKQILKLHPKQRAVIASGFSETDRVKETQKLGAGEYVKKPYTIENIGLAIKSEFDKRLRL